MTAGEYDDTDMTSEEFDRLAESATPVVVFNEAGAVADYVTASTAVFREESVRLAGNELIIRSVEFAGR